MFFWYSIYTLITQSMIFCEGNEWVVVSTFFSNRIVLNRLLVKCIYDTVKISKS